MIEMEDHDIESKPENIHMDADSQNDCDSDNLTTEE